MLISHSKYFIFIHIYKVAGTSIRNVLQPYAAHPLSNLPLLLQIKFYLGGKFHSLTKWSMSHLTASEARKIIPEKQWNNYFKFSFVRNPWDWQVSIYHYILQNKNNRHHRVVSKMKSFDDYIDWVISNKIVTQKSFLYDKNGACMVDYIGKFENLQHDFNEVLQKLGIKEVKLPMLNKSIHRSYKEYYNDKTRKLIEEAFKEDIELFGYEF